MIRESKDELINILGNQDPAKRRYAAYMLVMCHFHEYDKVGELFKSQDINIRKGATKAVQFLSWQGKRDISILIPFLNGLVNDDDGEIRESIAVSLRDAAVHKFDISSNINALAKVLKDNNYIIRSHVAQAIGLAISNGLSQECTLPIPELINLLSDQDDEVRASSIAALAHAAKKEIDISASIPNLMENLVNGGYGVRAVACNALLFFINKKTENAKMILDKINKYDTDKNVLEIKKVIDECESVLGENTSHV